MIGEQFDHGDEICGAVINVRGKQEKISIWTKNASNEAAQVIQLVLSHKFNSLPRDFLITSSLELLPYYFEGQMIFCLLVKFFNLYSVVQLK